MPQLAQERGRLAENVGEPGGLLSEPGKVNRGHIRSVF
jgi:hypothetical protein